MKVECVKNKLKDALLAADRVTGKQLSLPVLSYVLLLASEGMIKLRATNLELGVEITIPAKVSQEGVVAIPAAVLGNFLSYLPEEKSVTLELVGQNILVSLERHSTIIKCAPYEDFPSIPVIQKAERFSIDARQFTQGLRSVAFSASLSDIKPEFASVYCYTNSGYVHFVATDSSRLAEKKIAVKNTPDDLSILLPVKNTNEIIRLLENTSGLVDIAVSKNQLTITNEQTYITSRLIDGVFPDYHQIIPKQFTTEAVLLKDDLLNSLKITSVFSGKTQQVRVKIDPKEKLFELESRNDEIGESTNTIEAATKGEPVEFLFNQRLLLDALQNIPHESIALSAAGMGKPLVLKAVGDQSFMYLVMPMRSV